MSFNQDTIAGIATALSESGIGLVRLSGNDSISIVDGIFRCKQKLRCRILRAIRFIMVFFMMGTN